MPIKIFFETGAEMINDDNYYYYCVLVVFFSFFFGVDCNACSLKFDSAVRVVVLPTTMQKCHVLGAVR
jgi:hypothetical protein